jgi:hypothetical protein
MSNEKQREPELGAVATVVCANCHKKTSHYHRYQGSDYCPYCYETFTCQNSEAAAPAQPVPPQTIGENDPPPDPKGNWMGAPATPSPVLTPDAQGICDNPSLLHPRADKHAKQDNCKDWRPSASVLTQPSAEQCPTCRSPEKSRRFSISVYNHQACGFSATVCNDSWHESERPVLPVPRTHDDTVDLLQNLLAVIHRDGGHYVGEHGIEKAAEAAEKIVVSMRASRNETLQEALDACEQFDRTVEVRKCRDKIRALQVAAPAVAGWTRGDAIAEWFVELTHKGKCEGWWTGVSKEFGGWLTIDPNSAKRYSEAEAKAVAAALDYFPTPHRWSHWIATEHIFLSDGKTPKAAEHAEYVKATQSEEHTFPTSQELAEHLDCVIEPGNGGNRWIHHGIYLPAQIVEMLRKAYVWAALRESASPMSGTEMLNSILGTLLSRAEGVNTGGDINIMKTVDRIVKRESAREAHSDDLIEALKTIADAPTHITYEGIFVSTNVKDIARKALNREKQHPNEK